MLTECQDHGFGPTFGPTLGITPAKVGSVRLCRDRRRDGLAPLSESFGVTLLAIAGRAEDAAEVPALQLFGVGHLPIVGPWVQNALVANRKEDR